MAISLSPEHERLVQKLVDSGEYVSAEEVVSEALALLEERQAVNALRRERLLRDLADGVFQAENRHLMPADEVFRGLTAHVKEVQA